MKKCITYKEFQEVEKMFGDRVLLTGSDYDDKTNRVFYYLKFMLFAEYPLLIRDIHDRFGRDIEIETFWDKEPLLEVYIRGYRNEIRA